MLRRFGSVLRFEAGKALRSRMTWVILLLPVFVTFLSIGFEILSGSVEGITSGEDTKANVAPSAYLGFAKGASSGFIIGGILLLLYSSMIVANEGHWRTFKVIMLRPHRRIEWILGKFTLLLILAATMIVCVSAAAYLGGLMTGNYGAITEEGYVYFEAAFMAKASLRALALLIPPMIAMAAFGLMFSTMTDHTGIATSLCLGAYIILETVKGSMQEGRLYMFNTFMPSLLDTTRDFGVGSYFKALRGFADGMSDTGWAEHVVYYNAATPLVSALLFLIVAIVIFHRRDFLV